MKPARKIFGEDFYAMKRNEIRWIELRLSSMSMNPNRARFAP